MKQILVELRDASSINDNYVRDFIHPIVSQFLFTLDINSSREFLEELRKISPQSVCSIVSTYKNELSDYESIIRKCISNLSSAGDYSSIGYFLERQLQNRDKLAIALTQELLSTDYAITNPINQNYLVTLLTPLIIISEDKKELQDFLFTLLKTGDKQIKLTLAFHFILLGGDYEKRMDEITKADDSLLVEIREFKIKTNKSYLEHVDKIISDMESLPELAHMGAYAMQVIVGELGLIQLERLIALGVKVMDRKPSAAFHVLSLMEFFLIRGKTSIIGPLTCSFRSDHQLTALQIAFLDLADFVAMQGVESRPEVKNLFDYDLPDRINGIIYEGSIPFYFRRNALFLYTKHFMDNKLLEYLKNLLDHENLWSSAANILIYKKIVYIL